MNTSGNMSITRSQGNDDAVAILGSSPSMLAKIAGFVHDGEDGPRVEWAKVAELAHQKVLPRGDRAFFGICAEIAGFVTGDSDLEVVDVLPRAAVAHELSLEQRVERLGQRVVVAVAGRADGGPGCRRSCWPGRRRQGPPGCGRTSPSIQTWTYGGKRSSTGTVTIGARSRGTRRSTNGVPLAATSPQRRYEQERERTEALVGPVDW